jgi:hypothetical protein
MLSMTPWRSSRCPGAVARRRPALGPLLGVVTCCSLAAGCGSSGAPAKPVGQRVCDGGQRAAAAALGHPVTAHILNPAPSDLQCSLSDGRVRVMLVSQASAQAYTEFNTEDSHQAQVYGPASAGVHNAGQQPLPISVPGSVAAIWIRAQKMIVATDATPTAGAGSYVTVTVSGRRATDRGARSLAQAVARATFAAHPEPSS